MLLTTTHRPRNVNASRAAAILYGDWGTSKAYVIGLAFALAGYASFWPILAVSILSLFVGISYILICKFYPNGGGVYTSVRQRALENPKLEWLAAVGAFFLVADYLVTAALSALSAFYYFNVADPVVYSALFILIIGALNYLGPRHTGTFALIIAIAAVAVFTGLALVSLPFLPQGWAHLQAPPKNPLTFWTQFCTVIVALSGVETIANTTSIMKLNPGSTWEKPSVTRTATPAILLVMLEVVVYTTLFGLAATAITSFTFKDGTVSAPGYPDAGNYILTVMAQVFGTELMGSTLGQVFGHLLRIIVGLILLSAVNTAINGLVALQYIMASDKELPDQFRKTNQFGVPFYPLLIASVIPALLISSFRQLVLLADLYAIGFVGAIAVNLGSTSTDRKLPLKKRERVFMFLVFIVMALIEVTLFIQKSHARWFVLGIMALGLALRWYAKKPRKEEIPPPIPVTLQLLNKAPLYVVRRFGNAVKEAVQISNEQRIPVNILILHEQRFITDRDIKKSGQKDPLARRIFKYVQEKGHPDRVRCYYVITDSFADMASAYAYRLDAPQVIVDAPRSKAIALIRGNTLEQLRKVLPEQTKLVVLKKAKSRI